MPNFGPQQHGNGSKYALPQPRSRQKGQIESDPQLTLTEGEGAVEPCGQQPKTDEKLAQPGGFAVEGAEHVCRRPQEHPPEKAAEKALSHHLRGHRRHPRFSRGSS